MTALAMLWTLGIGTLIPLATAAVTAELTSSKVKTLVTALLAGVTGALAGFLTSPPHGTGQWEQVGLAILAAWIAAGATYVGGWKPGGVAPAVARRTSAVSFIGTASAARAAAAKKAA
jgi:hypothetical protein